jgi:hypothetical protein
MFGAGLAPWPQGCGDGWGRARRRDRTGRPCLSADQSTRLSFALARCDATDLKLCVRSPQPGKRSIQSEQQVKTPGQTSEAPGVEPGTNGFRVGSLVCGCCRRVPSFAGECRPTCGPAPLWCRAVPGADGVFRDMRARSGTQPSSLMVYLCYRCTVTG